MADSTDALLAIAYEMVATHGVRLQPEAVDEMRTIFDRTIGSFVQRAQEQHSPEHPWDNDDFRRFILGQVRRIASEVEKNSDGPASREVFHEAAQTVMRRTHEFCKIAMEKGRLQFVLESHGAFEGQVCSGYLAE